MQLTTTFWSDTVKTFGTLLFVKGEVRDGSSQFTTLRQVDLQDLDATATFFRELSKFVLLEECRRAYSRKDSWYQFAVMRDGEVCPLKWFSLVADNGLVLSHDIAFDTTLIQKNGCAVPLGQFPHWSKKRRHSRYRGLKVKSRAYKFISNQVRALARSRTRLRAPQ